MIGARQVVDKKPPKLLEAIPRNTKAWQELVTRLRTDQKDCLIRLSRPDLDDKETNVTRGELKQIVALLRDLGENFFE